MRFCAKSAFRRNADDDASLLVLKNGDLLALDTFEGPDGRGEGKIRSIATVANTAVAEETEVNLEAALA